MVTLPAERLEQEAQAVFQKPQLPEVFAFVEHLSPLHQRLFIVELWGALSRAMISKSEQDMEALVALIEGWEATAEVDSDPALAEYLRKPKKYKPFRVA